MKRGQFERATDFGQESGLNVLNVINPEVSKKVVVGALSAASITQEAEAKRKEKELAEAEAQRVSMKTPISIINLLTSVIYINIMQQFIHRHERPH